MSETTGTGRSQHDARCTCAACNPEECSVKNAARQHYCNLDKGHDGWHVDYEDRASWPTDDAS